MSYTAAITLINRGRAKNSLRLEEVPAEVREDFAWVLAGLGWVSADFWIGWVSLLGRALVSRWVLVLRWVSGGQSLGLG